MTAATTPYLPIADDLRIAVIGLDPGPVHSAVCTLNGAGGPITWAKEENEKMVAGLRQMLTIDPRAVLCVEMVASYGMPVGREVFETCVWIGRFLEAWEALGGQTHRLTRHDIKIHLCHSARANDATIRAALIDLYGPGKDKAVGKKNDPGPLYGMAGDEWAALAVARTYLDRRTL